MLWIKITNPITNQSVIALALIDTGSDNCAFPISIGKHLGYDLLKLPLKNVQTAGGPSQGRTGKAILEVLGVQSNGMYSNIVLERLKSTSVDFMTRLRTFLLGREYFLEKYTLKIEYDQQKFSLL